MADLQAPHDAESLYALLKANVANLPVTLEIHEDLTPSKGYPEDDGTRFFVVAHVYPRSKRSARRVNVTMGSGVTREDAIRDACEQFTKPEYVFYWRQQYFKI